MDAEGPTFFVGSQHPQQNLCSCQDFDDLESVETRDEASRSSSKLRPCERWLRCSPFIGGCERVPRDAAFGSGASGVASQAPVGCTTDQRWSACPLTDGTRAAMFIREVPNHRIVLGSCHKTLAPSMWAPEASVPKRFDADD